MSQNQLALCVKRGGGCSAPRGCPLPGTKVGKKGIRRFTERKRREGKCRAGYTQREMTKSPFQLKNKEEAALLSPLHKKKKKGVRDPCGGVCGGGKPATSEFSPKGDRRVLFLLPKRGKRKVKTNPGARGERGEKSTSGVVTEGSGLVLKWQSPEKEGPSGLLSRKGCSPSLIGIQGEKKKRETVRFHFGKPSQPGVPPEETGRSAYCA